MFEIERKNKKKGKRNLNWICTILQNLRENENLETLVLQIVKSSFLFILGDLFVL